MESEYFTNTRSPFSLPTSQDCFFYENWDKSTDHPLQFDSNVSGECFVIRELAGKLGCIDNNSGTISPHSPPRIGLDSGVAEFTSDPGFAERAARFSYFNGRTSEFGGNGNTESGHRTSPLTGNGMLPRVSNGSLTTKNSSNLSSELWNSSQEESCLSDQVSNGENGFKSSNEMNSRKRKASSKSKAKDPTPAMDAKRAKSNESVPEEEDEDTKENGEKKSNSKPPEPPKDYIHVRARRGQATDSHSLAERVRREKISERMKLLQDLVPGCNKVTGKALMLEEIINYVQSLQRQVEFLSMKLASVNTRLDLSRDHNILVPKQVFQSNPHPIFPVDSSAEAILDPFDSRLCNLHLPSLDPFNPNLPQFPTFCEDDLQTVVQMEF